MSRSRRQGTRTARVSFPAGRLAAAALVLAWACAAQFLWVVETPTSDAHAPASVRVVLATGLERLAAPQKPPASPQTPAPKTAPSKTSRALSDGAAPSGPKAPCLRRVLSVDLDGLAALADFVAPPICAPLVLHAPDAPAAADPVVAGASTHVRCQRGARPPPVL
jgi:hypothetical protein